MRQFIGGLLGAAGIGPYYIWWGSFQQFMADLLTIEAVRLRITGSAQAKIETTAEATTRAQAVEFAKRKARELGHPVKVVHFSGGKAWKVFPDGRVDIAPEVELADLQKGLPPAGSRSPIQAFPQIDHYYCTKCGANHYSGGPLFTTHLRFSG